MPRSKLYETLAAALPTEPSRQSRTPLLSLPEMYASATIGPLQGSGGNSEDSVSQLLQNTLKQANDTISQSNKQLSDLQTTQQQLLQGTDENTRALNSNTQVKGSAGQSVMSAAGDVASGLFGGSILSPIVSGLMSLFGGGEASEPKLTPFVMPAPVHIEAVMSGRASAQSTPAGQSGTQSSATAVTPPTSAQIAVQVNAIDSRSFLDHKDDIANAVRQALLNSHPLGDVIARL